VGSRDSVVRTIQPSLVFHVPADRELPARLISSSIVEVAHAGLLEPDHFIDGQRPASKGNPTITSNFKDFIFLPKQRSLQLGGGFG
jgi:hypothetical protein